MSNPIIVSNGQDEARIYRVQNRGKTAFQLSYYLAGVRQRRTFAKMNNARRAARIAVGRLAAVREGSEDIRLVEVEAYTAAKLILAPTALSLVAAVEIFSAASQILHGRGTLLDAARFYVQSHPSEKMTTLLADLVEPFIESRRGMGTCKSHVEAITQHLTRLVADFPKRTIGSITTQELDAWLKRLRCAAQTTNTYRRTIRSWGNWAKANGYLPPDRPTAFENTLKMYEKAAPVTIYSPEELRRLLCTAQQIRPDMVPWLACAAFTGARVCELAKLDWKHINFERGFVELASTKVRTKARRLVPLCPALKAWLEPIRQDSGRIAPCKWLRSVVRQIATQAGVATKANGFRHSYISYRLAEVQDTAKVALEAGNTPDIIFQHYRELVSPEDAQAWFGAFPSCESQAIAPSAA